MIPRSKNEDYLYQVWKKGVWHEWSSESYEVRHTAPYGNRRDPQAAAVPPPCPIKKKLSQAKPSKVVIAEEVKTLAAGFDPREAAECSKKWIPPPEARSRQKVSFIWILIFDWF